MAAKLAVAPPPRPLVGITADFVTPKNSPAYAKVNAGYVDAILAAGGFPVIVPPLAKANYAEIDAFLNMVSGVVFTGGPDLDPRKWGTATTSQVIPMPARREDAERYLLQKVAERKVPVLGIGVGMQLLNLFHGGNLFLHLPAENPKAMPHNDPSGGPHRHMVHIEDGSFLEEIYGPGEQRVNSMHHQAVNQIGKKLRVAARAPDGVIEAIETTDPNWFCVGLQWHPEADTASALDTQIFECFVQSAVRFAEEPAYLAAAA